MLHKPSPNLHKKWSWNFVVCKSDENRSDEDRVLHDIEASEIRATHLFLAVESMTIMPQTISTPPPQPKFHEAVQQSTIVWHQSLVRPLKSTKWKYRLRCSPPFFQALDKKLHMVWRWGLGIFSACRVLVATSRFRSALPFRREKLNLDWKKHVSRIIEASLHHATYRFQRNLKGHRYRRSHEAIWRNPDRKANGTRTAARKD